MFENCHFDGNVLVCPLSKAMWMNVMKTDDYLRNFQTGDYIWETVEWLYIFSSLFFISSTIRTTSTSNQHRNLHTMVLIRCKVESPKIYRLHRYICCRNNDNPSPDHLRNSKAETGITKHFSIPSLCTNVSSIARTFWSGCCKIPMQRREI